MTSLQPPNLRSPDTLVVIFVSMLLVLFSVSGAITPPIANTLPIGEFIHANRKIYSQHDEELIIRHFFHDRRDGVFLDVGCAWPRRNSTTFFLEDFLGWTGIGIDAVEHYHEAWKFYRPKSTFLHYAVCDKSGDIITFHQAAWSGVSSIYEEHVEHYSNRPSIPVDVRTITLNDILADAGLDAFDFLSMDIEGAEPLALTGFDIERYAPRLVCIEMHEGAENEDFVKDYFAKHGYQRIDEYLPYDPANWYYRPIRSR